MKTLYIFLSFTFFTFFSLNIQAQDPTFNLKMEGNIIDAGGGTFYLDLTLSMTGSASFGLGSSNLQFTFDTDISNPTLQSDNFTGNYAPLTVTEPASGKASLNVVLFLPGGGITITDAGSGWTELATVRFDVNNTAGNATLDWSYTGSTTETVVFKDTEIDQLFVDNPSTDLTGIAAFPLPIEYVNYYAEWNNGRETSAIISWETATESNNDHFSIERSDDSYKWESIGKVQGAGFSAAAIKYDFIDETVQQVIGENIYYRIKQVNFNGSANYTDIMVLNRTATLVSSTIFPTLFEDHLSVNIQSPEHVTNTFEVTFSDINGTTIQEFQMMSNSSLEISNLNKLQSGVYIILVKSGKYQFIQKTVKK